jgi:Arm domain-containing DNA-binding protein
MLTDTQVQQAEAHDKPYKLADWGGLYLHVLTTGSRIWRYDYRLCGKRATVTLGRYPGVTLTAVRELHAAARELVTRGESPAQAKRAKKAAAKQAARAAWEAQTRALEEALEQGLGTQRGIAAFAGKRPNELTAHESVVLSNACGTAFADALADRLFARLEKYVVRVPGGEEEERR